MRRLFITLAICISTVLGAQAQTYREQLKACMTTGATTISIDDVSGNLVKMLPAGTSNALIDRYAKEQLMDDLTDIMMPYYEKTTSMEDLKTLKAFYEKPEMKVIQQKIASLANGAPEKSMTQMEPAIRALMSGQEATDIKLDAGISNEYANMCNDYLKKAGLTDIFDGLFSTIKQMGATGSDPRMEKLLKYIERSIPAIMVNFLHESLTMDELKILYATTDTPAFKHMAEGNKAMMKDILPISMQMKEKAESWINSHK